MDTGGLDVAGMETSDLDVEADLNTHYFLAGISFHF